MTQLLVTLFTFSFFSLAFVGLMPVIAEENLGIDPKSSAYGVLYACFGLGAALGAITRRHRVRAALEGEAAAARRSSRSRSCSRCSRCCATPALGVSRQRSLLGYVYFVVITSLSTVLQDAPRRRAARAG